MVELWLWAMQYALDGDLSRFTDEEIAQAMGYQIGECLPSALKNILVTSGFADENLQLHDWVDRGKHLKQKRLAMRKLRARRGVAVTPVLPNCGAVLPLNIEHEHRTDLTPSLPSPSGGPEDEFSTFAAHYPIHRFEDTKTARQEFRKARKEVALVPLLEALDRDKVSEEWQRDEGRYVPHPTKWLRRRRWKLVAGQNTGPPKWEPPEERARKGDRSGLATLFADGERTKS